MFLAERLFGVTLYVSTLLIICYLITRAQPRSIGFLMANYLLCISVMAFFYVPAIEADLYRLTEYMRDYVAMSPSDFSVALYDSDTPASMMYLKLIGHTGISGLLAAVTTFIVFGNIFYIIYNYYKKSRLSNKVVAFSIFTVMSTGIYMQTVSGIRNMLAFSILARCFYDEICNGKRPWKNIVWYLLACLIHPAGLVAVLLRIIALVQDKISERRVRALITTIISLAVIVYFVISFGGAVYLENAIDKLSSYTSEVSYTYFWDNLITVITLVFIIVNYRIYRNYRNDIGDASLGSLIKLSYVMLIFSLVFLIEHTIFVRFTQFNLIIMLPVVMGNINFLIRKSKKFRPNVLMYKTLLYLPIVVLVISASRGALSSLKFFLLR